MNSQNSDVGERGRRKFQFGCFSQLLIALVLCVALVGLAVLTWTLAASRKLDAVLSDMRAAGYATSVAELESSYGPPPDVNSGPLWIAAGEALLADNASDTKALPFIGAAWRGDAPAVGDPFPELEACKAYLARHGKELAMIRQAASNPNPPRYRDSLLVSGPNKIVDRKHVQGHRQIQRVLQMKALVQAHEQDIERLCSTLLEQLRVGESLRDEPTLMGQLVAVVCTQMAVEDIQRYVRDCDFDEEQLRRLQTSLQQHDPMSQVRRGLEGEFVFALWSIDATTNPIPRYEDKELLAEQVFKMLEATESKQWGVVHETAKQIDQQCAAIETSPTQMARFALSAGVLRSYARLPDAVARLQTQLSAAESLVAAKRYKLKYGTLPTDLQQLAPEFLPEVPVDPFSEDGETLILTKTDGTAVIYGRSFNMVDDGGSSKAGEDGRPMDITVELE